MLSYGLVIVLLIAVTAAAVYCFRRTTAAPQQQWKYRLAERGVAVQEIRHADPAATSGHFGTGIEFYENLEVCQALRSPTQVIWAARLEIDPTRLFDATNPENAKYLDQEFLPEMLQKFYSGELQGIPQGTRPFMFKKIVANLLSQHSPRAKGMQAYRDRAPGGRQLPDYIVILVKDPACIKDACFLEELANRNKPRSPS